MPRKPTLKASDQVRRFLARIGAKGGNASAESLTAKQRSERAKHAVDAREAKRKKALNAKKGE